MAGQTKPAAKTAARKPAKKASVSVLTDAAKRGKVIDQPTEADVAANPNARGYNEHGEPRPADARASFLVVPGAPEANPDPTPEERAKATLKRGAEIRKARKAEQDKARKAAEGA